MAETRIPQILEKQLVERKNKTQIAQDLGVSRKTITRDTQTDLYQNIVDILKDLYITKIKEFMESDQATLSLEGTKEFGRIIRTGFTRQTKHTEDINIKASIDITEKRKQNEELINKMKFTPAQYRILEENVKPENLE